MTRSGRAGGGNGCEEQRSRTQDSWRTRGCAARGTGPWRYRAPRTTDHRRPVPVPVRSDRFSTYEWPRITNTKGKQKGTNRAGNNVCVRDSNAGLASGARSGSTPPGARLMARERPRERTVAGRQTVSNKERTRCTTITATAERRRISVHTKQKQQKQRGQGIHARQGAAADDSAGGRMR